MVTEAQIKEQYEQFMALIAEDERSEQLKVMYDVFDTRLIEAPAAMRVHWHNCFPGGYLDHVLRVQRASMKVAKTYKEIGGTLNFTKQELTFAALHHDLGKLGDIDSPYYIDQESDWHRRTIGEFYKMNPQMQYMNVTDRAVFMLQHFGIVITQAEWLAIKLSDGLYDEANKGYLKNSIYPYPMHTNLPYIIHTADYLSSNAERDQSKLGSEV